jgi:cytochrome c5
LFYASALIDNGYNASHCCLNEESNVVDLKTNLMRVSVMVVCALIFTGSVFAQTSEARIAERIKPAGEVCLAGEPCAGEPTAAAIGNSPPSSVASGETFNAEQTYQQSCAMCHNSGMAGAPKLDDADAWAARLEEKGLSLLVQNAITGINAMPPRGMCMTCSDENIETLVKYLLGQTE